MADTSTPLQLPCPACGSANRLPRERLADGPKCGRCGAALLPEQPLALTPDTFDRYLERSGLPVVVDFWAPWCGPCHAMAPHYVEAARRMRGRALFAKVDTESAPGLGARFGVQAIPTLIVFQDGQEVARRSGAMPTGELVAWLESAGA